MKNLTLIGLVFTLLCPISLFAEMKAEVEQLTEKEMVIQEKARKRLYPGGRDEEELIIHPSAVLAERKVYRSQIEKEVYKQLFNEELEGSSESDEASEAEAED